MKKVIVISMLALLSSVGAAAAQPGHFTAKPQVEAERSESTHRAQAKSAATDGRQGRLRQQTDTRHDGKSAVQTDRSVRQTRAKGSFATYDQSNDGKATRAQSRKLATAHFAKQNTQREGIRTPAHSQAAQRSEKRKTQGRRGGERQ